jgi:outer membrane protein, multidrug efflux system
MNTRTLITAAAALALSVSSCAMIPQFARPPLPMPDRFPASTGAMRDSAGSAAAVTDARSAAPPLRWREYFPDPRLRTVIERALASNRDLRIAALDVEQAATLHRIRRSELTPSVGVQGSGQKQWLPEKITGGSAEASEQYTVEAGFLSWEVDLFGRLRSLKAKALQDYLATEQTQRAVRTSLVSAVATSWLQLAADTEGLRLAEATIEAQTTSRDLIRTSRDAGVASDLDLSQAESQVETALASRAERAGAVGVDRHALELLVGSPLPDDLLPEGLSALAESPPLAVGLPSEVLLTRPDILAAEHQLRAANADIGAARAAFFPNISLTAAFGTLSPDLSHLFDSGTDSWRYAPVVRLPIFGGPERSNLKLTTIKREIAVASYEKAIQRAFAEVADALTLRTTLLEQREASDRLLVSLRQTLQLSDARYTTGLDSYLGVLEAQRSLYSAQQAAVNLRLAEKANRIALYKALGGGS